MRTRKMRAKLKIMEVRQSEFCDILKLEAVGPYSGYPTDGVHEDNNYSKFTPSASLGITITNPELIGTFKPGETYYVDFIKCIEPIAPSVSVREYD